MGFIYVRVIPRRMLVAVPVDVDARGPDAVTAWLRDHGFPRIRREDWEVDYRVPPDGPEGQAGRRRRR
ncbi:MAG: hypothetical protein K6U87_14080 [Firmicutes bacterium]|nr:hypothetical protein [Bacillota bacterium]